MTFPSKNPSHTYKFIRHNRLRIFLHADDRIPATIQTIRREFNRLNLDSKFYSSVYYLRGHNNKVDYDQVLIGALEAGQKLPKSLWEVVHCLAFWNQEGAKCYEINKSASESYRDFILHCFAADCRVFVELGSSEYITGTGGNHVWISDKNTGKRILIFHFIKDNEGAI